MISVALCTYNGARFVREQLDSIASQTRLPGELVVHDDASTDDTARLVSEFASQVAFPVRLQVQAQNVGSTRNFETAIAACAGNSKGDIIVLSDQDDVWRPDKLEKMAAVFEARPSVGLVFSDAELVDEELRPLGKRLWSAAGLTPQKLDRVRACEAFRPLLARNFVTGATMAFRAAYKALVLPFPPEMLLIHDGWIALLLSAVCELHPLDEPLIWYRQHAAQQMGAAQPQRQLLTRDYYAGHIRQLQVLRERLLHHQGGLISPAVTAFVAEIPAQMAHIQKRIDLPEGKVRRFWPVSRELLSGRYHRHSNGWASAARDLWF